MEAWRSYPKVYNIGHPAIAELFEDEVIVEEKVDGSQLSFARFGDRVLIRSRGREFDINAPDNLFQEAAETVKFFASELRDGWVYRGEYLKRPKHNTLKYDRIPRNHFIVFDINTGEEQYLGYDAKAAEASRIGFDVVPILYRGRVTGAKQLMEMLDRDPFLGGAKIEGVVAKNYARFSRDGKAMMGKHVSEAFKEVHTKEWKKQNPSNGDVMTILCEEYQSEARWRKAVEHLRDAGGLEGSPRDIGALMKEVHRDIDEECAEEIKSKLYGWAAKHVKRSATRGLPEWYKARLVEQQFGGE